MQVSREQVLRFRVHAQQLDVPDASPDAVTGVDPAILDLGVQDTGPDGARWALTLRGRPPSPRDAEELLTAWSVRGAPHVYRRAEAAQVAAAVAPLSEADAAKRVFDAAKQLKAAGIPVLDALDHVAEQMRDVVRRPTVKGELSGALRERLAEPYLRHCRPCDAVHAYEQTFRLAALRAGLELEAGSSPPVLRRIPGWRGVAASVPEHLDPVRAVLRFLGPATPRLVASYLDAPVREVQRHWPADVVDVEVEGEHSYVLAADETALADPPQPGAVRLLGPFDLLLQGRDRELVVPDEAARKDLWRTLGRPGAILVGSELVGSWRPRSRGRRLALAATTWSGDPLPAGVAEQAERLAAFRDQAFGGFVES